MTTEIIDEVRTHIVTSINANRARRGLPALTLDSHLTAVSQEWADYLAQNKILIHGDFAARIQAVYPATEAAENIAEGYSANTLVTAWMCDKPHRDNILGPYTVIGIGVALSPAGDVFYVADFDALRTAQAES